MNNSSTAKKMIGGYNFIILTLMCFLNLSPAVNFYLLGEGEWMYFFIFLITSGIVLLLPDIFFDVIQIGKSTTIYEGLRVHVFKRFASNGDVINNIIRKKYPHHRNFSDLKSIHIKLLESYSIEKSHWFFFLFCLLTAIYAFKIEYYKTAILLLFSNIIFNLYPNFLQQYNRIRFKRLLNYPTRRS